MFNASKKMDDLIETMESIQTSKMKKGILFITEDDSIIGQTDTSKLDSLVWYKRLYALINKKYRDKYIRVKPFRT